MSHGQFAQKTDRKFYVVEFIQRIFNNFVHNKTNIFSENVLLYIQQIKQMVKLPADRDPVGFPRAERNGVFVGRLRNHRLKIYEIIISEVRQYGRFTVKAHL